MKIKPKADFDKLQNIFVVLLLSHRTMNGFAKQFYRKINHFHLGETRRGKG